MGSTTLNELASTNHSALVAPANDQQGGSMIERKTTTGPELEAVDVLMSALEPFRAHNPTMPLQLAFTFLMVARDEGKPVSDYARAAGMAPGVMARNLLDLGDYNRRREPGMMLVEERIDPMDRRVHRKFLTHKGRALVGAITRAMGRMKKVAVYLAYAVPFAYSACCVGAKVTFAAGCIGWGGYF